MIGIESLHRAPSNPLSFLAPIYILSPAPIEGEERIFVVEFKKYDQRRVGGYVLKLKALTRPVESPIKPFDFLSTENELYREVVKFNCKDEIGVQGCMALVRATILAVESRNAKL